MERILNIGLFLLAIIFALQIYGFAHLINPDAGVFSESIYPREELSSTFYGFIVACGLAVLSALVALVGVFWEARSKAAPMISVYVLITSGGIAWWKYSSLFFQHM